MRREEAGVSLIEVIVVVAVVVMIAAAVAPKTLDWIDEGRATRARNDALAIAAAMNRFFQDTTKWPGQVEILEAESAIRFLTVGNPTAAGFPGIVGSVGIGAATCASGLTGVKAGVTAFAAAVPSASNSLNITDFLTSPPAASDYANWRGPYLNVELSGDPWERVYVVNVIPLFCDEEVSAASPGGQLGFGWVMSGGPNNTLQTPFTVTRPLSDGDDVGIPLGKRAVQPVL